MTCRWNDNLGGGYEYHVHPLGTSFKDVPGNYIFAKVVQGRWKALYIGETTSLAKRLCSQHECWEAVTADGATHIHARVNSAGEDARCREEQRLIEAHHPPHNVQHSLLNKKRS